MSAEWPTYVSHKIVRAARIWKIEDAGQGKLTIFVKPYGDDRTEIFEPTLPELVRTAEVGGYAMVYPDGYKSLSPRKAFIDGYARELQPPAGV